MPEAVTTQHETLWIGVNRSAMVRVPYVVSSPEIADPVQPIDATNLASDMKVYIPGIKDYSGDLVWEANSQRYRPGELRDLLAMDGCHVWAERRMPMVGMRVSVEGEASVSMSAADPDGVQRVTVRIAPTAPMSVEEWTPDMSDGYLYRIHTDSAGMNVLDVQAGYGGRPLSTVITSSTRRQGAASIPEVWRFNGGVGPFGCWYGAFNIQDYVAGTESEEPVCAEAGRLAYRLDPYNLKRSLAGTVLAGTYNVMLVIPTVYWKTEGANLYLSSASGYRTMSGMVAYAHTATLPGGGTKVYPYIGIGVYESYSDGTRLLSASGSTPATDLTHDQYKALADGLDSAGSSDFQMWNYYHWTLYKMMSYAVLGTKNAQWVLQNGMVAGAIASGLRDGDGPYADGGPSKMFIESPWGNLYNQLGDTVTYNNILRAGSSLGGEAISASRSNLATLPDSGWSYYATASTEGQTWDLPLTVTGSDNSADPAFAGDAGFMGTGTRTFAVGGDHNRAGRAGLSCISCPSGSGSHGTNTTTRLSAYLDDYAMGLTDEAPAALMSAPLTLSMGLSTPDEEEAEESEEPTEEPEENYGEDEETPEETDTIEEDMR